MPYTPQSAVETQRPVWGSLLHIGFAFTGVGTVLLGCILPRLSLQWHLRDKDAGLLLLIQFAASASGALGVRRDLKKSLSIGYAFFGFGGLLICLLQRGGFIALGSAFAVFGFGMGAAMTSTNMLVARRHAEHRGAALSLLNFAWSAGAVACPIVAAPFLRHALAGTAFALLGVGVLPWALLPLLADRQVLLEAANKRVTPSRQSEAPTIVFFALLAFLYVGVEATLGNWMSTFAVRTAAWRFSGGSLAVAVFWGTFLLGRAGAPAVLRVLPDSQVYRACVLATLAGTAVLLRAHGPLAVLAGAAFLGVALAPMFPLTISLFLGEISTPANAGWVFAIAGLGGAVLSWLTGLVSTNTGSLRLGLLVPTMAALLMLAMVTWRRSTG